MRSKSFFFLRPQSVLSIPSQLPILSFSVGMPCQHDSAARISLKAPKSSLYSTSVDSCPFLAAKNSNGLLWIDTDVGFDDLVAIGCCGVPSNENRRGTEKETCIGDNRKTMMAGISTVGGGLTSNPSDGFAVLQGLTPETFEGPNAIPLVAGQTERLASEEEETSNKKTMEDPSWLAKCREQMIEFCASQGIFFRPKPEECYRENTNDIHKFDEVAATRVQLNRTKIDGINYMHPFPSTEKVDMVCLGPLTNLAHWLEEVPNFARDHLNSIWILGGNIPICQSSSRSQSFSSTNSSGDSTTEDVVQAEFNFSRDPEAVRTVFQHVGLRNIPIYVVPQEVCDRKAFEKSFDEDLNAANIIENWLQSSRQSSSESQAGTRSHQLEQTDPMSNDERDDNTKPINVAPSALETLLPGWMVRLIRKRTFSVYGDPICIYARHQTCAMISNVDSRPRILWKDYETSSTTNDKNTSNKNSIFVDSEGRLLLTAISSNEKSLGKKDIASPLTFSDVVVVNQEDTKQQHGNSVRIAHEVELGPIYMDWLAMSLVSSGTK